VGGVGGRVARLAWPVIGEQLLLTLVGVVDVAMVGRLGPAAVAGVGAATQLTQVAIASMGAVGVGTTVLVARATGARRPAEAARVTQQSLLVGAALGAALALLGWIFARRLIQLLGPEAAVVDLGALYLRVDALALPALATMLVAGGAFRGAGDTRTPLLASAGMNVINVTLAYLLIFGKLGLPALGVAHAATRSALWQALFWMTLAGLFFAGFAGPLMRLFSTDPDVIALGRAALPVLALAQPFWAIGQVYAGSLRGAGDARFPMIATSLSMWLVRLPTAYLFGIVLGGGLPGVYLSSVLDSGVRAVLNYLRHRTGRWQRLTV
jgi:Na+-driven multidrug efflux pump